MIASKQTSFQLRVPSNQKQSRERSDQQKNIRQNQQQFQKTQYDVAQINNSFDLTRTNLKSRANISPQNQQPSQQPRIDPNQRRAQSNSRGFQAKESTMTDNNLFKMLDQFKLSPQLSYGKQYFNSSSRNSRVKKKSDTSQVGGALDNTQYYLNFNDTSMGGNGNNFQFSKFLEEMSTDKQSTALLAVSSKKNQPSQSDQIGSLRNTNNDDLHSNSNFVNLNSNFRLQSNQSRQTDNHNIASKMRETTAKALYNDSKDLSDIEVLNLDCSQESSKQQQLSSMMMMRQTKYRSNRYKSPFQPIRAIQTNNNNNTNNSNNNNNNLNSSVSYVQNNNNNAGVRKSEALEAKHPRDINIQMASTQFSSQFSNQPQNSFFNSASINFSADVSKSLEEEDAIVEEMHYYFVEFQQKSKDWLRKIESNL